jgi:hypothetical protein
VLDGIIMSDSTTFRADVGRSVRLLRACRTEKTAPEAYYTALARDTILQLRQYTELDGRIVIDVGGGPGFFVRELNRMGARSFCIDADSGEMAALGPPEGRSIVASATSMPQRSSRTGTGPGGQFRTTAPVPSVLALSTTTIAAGSGRPAALRHSSARPSGSRRASFRAGTTISSAA